MYLIIFYLQQYLNYVEPIRFSLSFLVNKSQMRKEREEIFTPSKQLLNFLSYGRPKIEHRNGKRGSSLKNEILSNILILLQRSYGSIFF